MFSMIRKRFTFANVAMTFALVFAMAGGAYAAKKGWVITSTKQIKPSVIAALKGKEGPVGPKGEPGVPGKNGTNGVNGTNGERGEKGEEDILCYLSLTSKEKSLFGVCASANLQNISNGLLAVIQWTW